MDGAVKRHPAIPVLWLWIVAIVLADQVTKVLAIAYLKYAPPFSVIPGFFSLCYVENRGAAWGVLHGRQPLLVFVSLAAILLLFWKRAELFGNLRGGRFIFAVLLGGILGNLIDRIRVGYVVDFLDFYWRQSHFPAFNIADSSICLATFFLLIAKRIDIETDEE